MAGAHHGNLWPLFLCMLTIVKPKIRTVMWVFRFDIQVDGWHPICAQMTTGHCPRESFPEDHQQRGMAWTKATIE